jgi:hypothetical protein
VPGAGGYVYFTMIVPDYSCVASSLTPVVVVVKGCIAAFALDNSPSLHGFYSIRRPTLLNHLESERQ